MSKRKKIRCENICAHNLKIFEADHLDTITLKIAKNNFVLQLADFNYIDHFHVSSKFLLFLDYG